MEMAWHGNAHRVPGPMCGVTGLKHKGSVMQSSYGFFVVKLDKLNTKQSGDRV